MNTKPSSLAHCLLVLLALLVCACEKAYIDLDGETPAGKGNLNISVFQIEQTPFTDYTRTAAADACTRLNFAVYNTAGTRVKQTNQQLGNAGFGSASFQLEEGTYQLVIVGHSSNGNPTMTNPAKIQFTNAQGFSDTFLYSHTVEVNDEAQSLKVSLDRIVSLCRFVITDDYPEGVTRMRFKYTGGSGAFNAYTGFGCVKSTQTVTFDVATGKKQFDLYTFLHETTGVIELEVTALDAVDNVLNQRDFRVPLQQNKITWCEGDYFNDDDSHNSTVDIDINTKWDGEIRITF